MLDRELSERKWSNVKAEDLRDAGEYVYWNYKNTKNCVAIGGKTKRGNSCPECGCGSVLARACLRNGCLK